MSLLIDGHNLIPKLPGLSLQAEDDEMQLIEWLQAYCRQRRKKVEVFFDNAPPGHAGPRRFGPVTARFVARGSSADEAIRKRLAQLGKEAGNWTVVTSDHHVQSEARAAHAEVLSGEAFAQDMIRALTRTGSPSSEPKRLSPEEMREWLALFGGTDEE